jgi:hypothetical protein
VATPSLGTIAPQLVVKTAAKEQLYRVAGGALWAERMIGAQPVPENCKNPRDNGRPTQ